MYRNLRININIVNKTMLLLLCLFICTSGIGVFAEEETLIDTALWEPPVIDEEAAQDQPWLWVLKIAQEEVGYVEGPLPNETKYGEWFCHDQVAWCAEFLTWCMDQAQQRYDVQLSDIIYPFSGKSGASARWFIRKGRFVSPTGKLPDGTRQWLIGDDEYLTKNSYIPSVGDYMWVCWGDYEDGPSHTALVEGVSRDADGMVQIHVIEGNNPDRVQRATYPLTDKRIYGFGAPMRRSLTLVKIYSKGENVSLLCRLLEAAGYYTVPKKGYPTEADSAVQKAIRKFNKEWELTGGSTADIDTWEKLMELYPEIQE